MSSKVILYNWDNLIYGVSEARDEEVHKHEAIEDFVSAVYQPKHDCNSQR